MTEEEFCSYIFELRKNSITRSEMGKKWPWHKNTIIGYEKNRLPDVDYLYAICIETGHDFNDLVKKRLSAGFLKLPEDVQLPGEVCETPGKYELDDHLLHLIINDDSMEPTIQKSAVLYIDTKNKTLKNGLVVAIKLNGEILARRVQYGLDSISLVADNKIYMPIDVPKKNEMDVQIIGVVKSTNNPL